MEVAADGTRPAGQEGQQQVQQIPKTSIRDYFKWRPLPWWLVFFLGVFLLTKLQLVYNDSPCAVLGTQSPVNVSDIKRAFRSLSMCTHPDRLRGRLSRPPTPAESRRGETLFNRASAARDELTKVLKLSGKKSVACYQGELELAIIQLVGQAGRALTSLGVWDYVSFAKELFWNLATFESGFFNTILSALWLAFVFRVVKQFLLYLWRLGIIRGTLAIVTTTVIGPIPTVVHFIVLPFIRLGVFLSQVSRNLRLDGDGASDTALPSSPTGAAGAAAGSSGPESASEEAKTTTTGPSPAMLAAMKVREDLPARNIRQRKKKETEEEREKRNKELLTGGSEVPLLAEPAHQGQGQPGQVGPMPESLWQCVQWGHREPLKARQAAACAVQFDLLLILTKPVIPLFMLLALGQVWNGLFSSLFIGHALRRWVPQMSYEAHHLICSFFGMVHTVLGVSAQQVEDYANREGKKVLHLAWHWTIKDVLSVMHMCQLGATVTAMAALGNEPSYAASFAAGIALRMALAQDSVQGLGIIKYVTQWAEVGLRDLGVTIDAAEEVVAYSGHGIGDCGGGPFRMLFGDGPQARWAALALKFWLLLLPLLSTLQWLQRTVQAGRLLGKRWKTTRFVQRLILFLLGAVQCWLIANVELNASNGALGNFWIAMLIGCVGESLLSTYDIRGPVRQIVFLVLFLLI